MNENLKAILKAVSEDDALRAQAISFVNELNAVTDETRPEVVARIVDFANDRGFELSEEDLILETPEVGELAEDELMAVTGGSGTGDASQGCGAPLNAVDNVSKVCGTPAVTDEMQRCRSLATEIFFPSYD